MRLVKKVTATIQSQMKGERFTFLTNLAGGKDIQLTRSFLLRSGFLLKDMVPGTTAVIDYEIRDGDMLRVVHIHQLGEKILLPTNAKWKHPLGNAVRLATGSTAAGRIKSKDKKHGFVTHEGFDYFFHLNDATSSIIESTLVPGACFEFKVIKGQGNKSAAALLRLVNRELVS